MTDAKGLWRNRFMNVGGELERGYQGLTDKYFDLSQGESAWVICQMAELKGWGPMDLVDDLCSSLAESSLQQVVPHHF
jgi:hypothetical protein